MRNRFFSFIFYPEKGVSILLPVEIITSYAKQSSQSTVVAVMDA
jgi:hypothetical protein